MTSKLVGLIRVSTDKQEKSGLGLEAQQADIEAYRKRTGSRLLKTFTEIESGGHDDIASRPQLQAAVAHAKRNKAILVIARIDRLVRSTIIGAYLKQSGVPFVACDNPNANELTIDILIAVAADERRRISQRTKAALKAYKDGRHVSKRIRDKYDGNPPAEIVEATAGKLGATLPQCQGHLTPDARKRGWEKSAGKRKDAALKAYADVAPRMLALWKDDGLSLRAIAELFNAEDASAADGEDESPSNPTWSAMKVKRVLDRARQS